MKSGQPKPIYYDGSGPLQSRNTEQKFYNQTINKPNPQIKANDTVSPPHIRSERTKNEHQKPIYYDGSGPLQIQK